MRDQPAMYDALRDQMLQVSTELSTVMFYALSGSLSPGEQARLQHQIDALELQFADLLDMLREYVAERAVAR